MQLSASAQILTHRARISAARARILAARARNSEAYNALSPLAEEPGRASPRVPPAWGGDDPPLMGGQLPGSVAAVASPQPPSPPAAIPLRAAVHGIGAFESRPPIQRRRRAAPTIPKAPTTSARSRFASAEDFKEARARRRRDPTRSPFGPYFRRDEKQDNDWGGKRGNNGHRRRKPGERAGKRFGKVAREAKYKTQLCFFFFHGRCTREGCAYAHGRRELRALGKVGRGRDRQGEPARGAIEAAQEEGEEEEEEWEALSFSSSEEGEEDEEVLEASSSSEEEEDDEGRRALQYLTAYNTKLNANGGSVLPRWIARDGVRTVDGGPYPQGPP